MIHYLPFLRTVVLLKRGLLRFLFLEITRGGQQISKFYFIITSQVICTVFEVVVVAWDLYCRAAKTVLLCCHVIVFVEPWVNLSWAELCDSRPFSNLNHFSFQLEAPRYIIFWENLDLVVLILHAMLQFLSSVSLTLTLTCYITNLAEISFFNFFKPGGSICKDP